MSVNDKTLLSKRGRGVGDSPSFHVWILDVSQWDEGLLDGLGRGKLEHVGRSTSLVIGSWKYNDYIMIHIN